ncbi:hypothetical protein GGR53DRAFT_27247 [Hypoxylon sp. FL1150]|nr:hypothetical protein GGR53DRAFT_27247 [Hypoxylon sp. FL1150]
MACLLRPKQRRKTPIGPYVQPRSPPRHPTSPHLQSQSPLFGALPYELRLEIYTLVLECSPISIMPDGLPRLIKLRFLGPNIEVVRQARLLSLSLTCWRGYIEALPVLYSINTFSIHLSESVRLLASGVGPGPQLIRRLEFFWKIAKPPVLIKEPSNNLLPWLISRQFFRMDKSWCQEWTTTWEAMGKLEGLQWLHVELDVSRYWMHRWQEYEKEIVMPLSYVLKDGAKGRLKIPWDRTEAEGKAAEDILKGWLIERPSKSSSLLRFSQ